MHLTASVLTLALSAALATNSPAPQMSTPMLAPVHTVREEVQDYFSDIPIMAKIAGCESHYRQFDTDGSVYRGEQNHLDVGVMQINEHYHLDTAQSMGLDIHTLDGNMKYARYLYEHEGTAPWVSSSYCWNTDGTEMSHGDHWATTSPIASAVK